MKLISCFALTALAAALCSPAHARLTTFDNQDVGDGNSSLTFMALDETGIPASVVVDLGYFFDDFRPVGAPNLITDFDGNTVEGYLGSPGPLANTPGTTISWDFANNTTTLNGVTSTMTNGKANEWATQGLNESIGPLMIHGTMESKNIAPGTDIALNIPRFEAGLCYPNEGPGFGIDLNEAFLVSNKTSDKDGFVLEM